MAKAAAGKSSLTDLSKQLDSALDALDAAQSEKETIQAKLTDASNAYQAALDVVGGLQQEFQNALAARVPSNLAGFGRIRTT